MLPKQWQALGFYKRIKLWKITDFNERDVANRSETSINCERFQDLYYRYVERVLKKVIPFPTNHLLNV